MTIAHDTATVATAYTSTGTQTTSHGGSASTKAVVVLIDQNGTTTDEVSGVTYGGVAMQRVDSSTEATEAGRIYMYWLSKPPTGTQDVAMTTTAATNKQLVCCTMTGSDYKTIKLGGFGTGTSASVANPSWSVTGLPTACTVVAYEVIHSGLTTMTNTPATNWTLISSTDLGAQGRGFARQTVGNQATSTLTCGWTAATADDFVGDAIAFYEDDNLANYYFGAASANDNSLFEGGTTGNWAGSTIFGGYAADTVANSATRAFEGTKSMLLTHPTSALGSASTCDVLGLVDGARYTYDARVWVPTGSADVRIEVAFFTSSGYTSTKDAWVELQTDFIADSGLHANMAVESAAPSTSGQQVWVDRAVMYATNYLAVAAATSATGARGLSTGITAVATTAALTATGTAAMAGGVSVATTATLTATGTVGTVGDVASPITATLASTGTAVSSGVTGDAERPVTVSLTSAGSRDLTTGSTLANTATLTSTGARGLATTSSLAALATLTSTGARGLATTATAVAVTAAITATGVVGVSTGSSVPTTATVTATGARQLSTTSSVPITAATTATASAGKLGNVTIAFTTGLTATGTVSKIGNAALATTAGLTATGSRNLATGSTLAVTTAWDADGNATSTPTGNTHPIITATITASGVVGVSTGASRANVATTTATGARGASTGSTLATTATTTAAGTRNAVAGATRTVTATTTAAATIATAGDATRPVTAAITATATVHKFGTATLPVDVTLEADGLVDHTVYYDAPEHPRITLTANTFKATITTNRVAATITTDQTEAEL